MTKMIYRPNRGAFRRSSRWWILVLLALVILGWWRPPLLIRPASQLAVWLARPVWWASGVIQNGLAGEKNQILRRRLAALELELLDHERIVSENALLRDALDWRTPDRPTYVGQIISAPRASPYDILLVWVGRPVAVQLKIGDPVFFERAVLLGEVVEIFSDTVKIELLSAPGHRLLINLGDKISQLEIAGRGDGNFTATLPRGVEIDLGTAASLPLEGENWVVATVGAVDTETGSSLQKLFLRIPLNLNQLQNVVIRPKS